MIALICNRGCRHEERWCPTSIEHDRCERCDRDGEPTCDVARFVVENFADCQRRFSRHNCGHLTGFSRRAFAALVHLADAAQVADPTNRTGIMTAITAVLTCRSVREHPSFARDMIDDDSIAKSVLWALRDIDSKGGGQ